MKFDSHETDLYLLPESKEEREKIEKFLRGRKPHFHWFYSFSNVEGQNWYGKSFMEIPFGITLKKEIEDIVKTH